MDRSTLANVESDDLWMLQLILTILLLMGLTGTEILSGLHHLLDASSPLSLMDVHCTLALPQITFLWIILHEVCSIIVAHLAFVFVFQQWCVLGIILFHFKS